MEMDTLNALINERLECGQMALANHVRALVYKAAPQIFDRLEFDDDFAFLEPALFAWFTDSNVSTPIEQQLLGLLAPEQRPSATPVKTDARGRIYVPKLGTFYTHQLAREGYLMMGDRGWLLATDNWREPILLTPPVHLGFKHLPCFLQVPQIWRRFFEHSTTHVTYNLKDCVNHSSQQIAYLETALAMIEQQDHQLAQWLSTCVQGIQLYQADQPNSFATLSVHGMAFLNVSNQADEIFYLDDLAHQCGHVIFNTATHPPTHYLACAADTPLAKISKNSYEQRSVYSAFHGLCTYSLIIRTLWQALDSHRLDVTQTHQAKGRLGFYLCKFSQDLRALSAQGLFTAQGTDFYQAFKKVFSCAYEHFAGDLADLDLRNQPYVFDTALFWQANPCEYQRMEG